jgi:hypothetical protein
MRRAYCPSRIFRRIMRRCRWRTQATSRRSSADPNEKESNFVIGYTREQNHPVCIDLEKFVQRSSGVFGATGTGKSFLTRLVLAGLMHYNKASVLVLDMHNEYGFDDVASDTKKAVTGLKTKFKSKVESSAWERITIRGQVPDFNLEISTGDISTSDIETLTRVESARDHADDSECVVCRSGKIGFARFKAMNRLEVMIEDDKGKDEESAIPRGVWRWANENGVNVMAAEALHDKLRRLFSKPYIVRTLRRTACARSSSRWRTGSMWCCRSASMKATWIICWCRTC